MTAMQLEACYGRAPGAAHRTIGRKKDGLMEVSIMGGSVTHLGCIKTVVSPRRGYAVNTLCCET